LSYPQPSASRQYKLSGTAGVQLKGCKDSLRKAIDLL
jgi:hypothetical protein